MAVESHDDEHELHGEGSEEPAVALPVQVQGTVLYMAPELSSGNGAGSRMGSTVSSKSDMYSLGMSNTLLKNTDLVLSARDILCRRRLARTVCGF
jgi:serine/threonine protein kinase